MRVMAFLGVSLWLVGGAHAALPDKVNPQVTDSVTQDNVKVASPLTWARHAMTPAANRAAGASLQKLKALLRDIEGKARTAGRIMADLAKRLQPLLGADTKTTSVIEAISKELLANVARVPLNVQAAMSAGFNAMATIVKAAADAQRKAQSNSR